MENQNQIPNQVPVQKVVAKLSRLAALLGDLKRAGDEYWGAYRQEIDLGISGMNVYEHVDIECGNGYMLSFNPNTVYVYLKTPDKGGYRVLDHGKGAIGDVLSVPEECWDRLIHTVEGLIRKKDDEIERFTRFYRIFTATF